MLHPQKASIEERKNMKYSYSKENAYTGHVPLAIRSPPKPEKTNRGKGVVGYRGYRPISEEKVDSTARKSESKELTRYTSKESAKSGYGLFMENENDHDESRSYTSGSIASSYGHFRDEKVGIQEEENPFSPTQDVFKVNEHLFERYEKATHAIGGNQGLQKVIDLVVNTFVQRGGNRGDSLRRIKRAFQQYNSQQGKVNFEQFEAVLGILSCVLSEDQVIALFGHWDKDCTGDIDWKLFLEDLPF